MKHEHKGARLTVARVSEDVAGVIAHHAIAYHEHLVQESSLYRLLRDPLVELNG